MKDYKEYNMFSKAKYERKQKRLQDKLSKVIPLNDGENNQTIITIDTVNTK